MPILTMYLKVLVSFLLLVAHPALSFPRELDSLNQDAASLSFPSNPLCDHHLKDSHCEERLPRQPTRHKRAGRVAQGSAIILHAFQAATYIGARAVLERLYTQVLVDATQRAAGTTTAGPEYEYGDVYLSFLTSNDGIPWDIIRQFADMMLTRILNGDQNFYIADVVYDDGDTGHRGHPYECEESTVGTDGGDLVALEGIGLKEFDSMHVG